MYCEIVWIGWHGSEQLGFPFAIPLAVASPKQVVGDGQRPAGAPFDAADVPPSPELSSAYSYIAATTGTYHKRQDLCIGIIQTVDGEIDGLPLLTCEDEPLAFRGGVQRPGLTRRKGQQ
jgi:hypothetical protein